MNAVIIGGTGGIGKAFVDYLAATGKYDICATFNHHRPDDTDIAKWFQLDVTDEQQVAEFCMQLGEVDLCINTVGMLHDDNNQPEKSTRHIDSNYFLNCMRVNTMPTLLLAKSLAGHFRHKRPAVFATISARVGSIGENHLGGWYSYRASKAALNQILKTLSIEWQRNLKNVSVAALHPGTTDTGLSRPFQKNVPADQLFSPQQSVAYMMQVIGRLQPGDSGKFWSFDGEELPW